MTNATRVQVLEYLQAHRVATLATEADGNLWAAAVFYVSDGFTLYFLSSPTSRHGLNLAGNPRVAATIHEDYADWTEIKGVQLEGVTTQLSGADETAVRTLYAKKFPIAGDLAQAPEAIVRAMARVRWYRLDPRRIFFINNAAGFGSRAEVDIDA